MTPEPTHLLLKGRESSPNNHMNSGFPLFMGDEAGCMVGIQHIINNTHQGYTINKVTKVEDNHEYTPCRRIIYTVMMTSDYFFKEEGPQEQRFLFIIVQLPLHINRKLSE